MKVVDTCCVKVLQPFQMHQSRVGESGLPDVTELQFQAAPASMVNGQRGLELSNFWAGHKFATSTPEL